MRGKEHLTTKHEKMTLKQAKVVLQDFLDKNRLAIKTIRSCRQFLENIGDVDLGSFEDLIKNLSKGRLHWFSGVFCTISDEGEVFAQNNNAFLGIDMKDVKVVKGLYFSMVLAGHRFEYVDLDFGLSREYFDKKSPGGKEKFMRRFAERRKQSAVFIGDQGKKFTIEMLISYRNPESPKRLKLQELSGM